MSSKILTPPPLSARRVCSVPPHLVRGEDTLARRRGGWGVNILEDARHSSVLYVCKYFVVPSNSVSKWIPARLLCYFVHHSGRMLRVDPDRCLAHLSKIRGVVGRDLFSDGSLKEQAAWAEASWL